MQRNIWLEQVEQIGRLEQTDGTNATDKRDGQTEPMEKAAEWGNEGLRDMEQAGRKERGGRALHRFLPKMIIEI